MAARSSKRTPSVEVLWPRLLLTLCVMGLLLLGLVMVFSASSIAEINGGGSAMGTFRSQLIFMILGVICAVVLWKLPYHLWTGRLVVVLWVIALVLLGLTALMGRSEYGAQRWLSLGGFSLQPSEFAKIAFLLTAVAIIGRWRSGAAEPRAIATQMVLFVLLPVLFLYWSQSDLGTTLICAVGIFAVLWMGGVPVVILATICGVGLAFVFVAVFGTDYRSDRMVYLNPWDDGEGGYGTGYNMIRSYYALAEGGLFGVGLGNSHEKYLYLFASDSDFIFAIIGEELGMVGALLTIAAYGGILVAGLRIAQNAPDPEGAMIAGGCTIMLVFQAALNIGSVIGVLPTTGKPLPFISSGGSALLAAMILVGLILAVSQAQSQPDIYDYRRSELRVVRATKPSARKGR